MTSRHIFNLNNTKTVCIIVRTILIIVARFLIDFKVYLYTIIRHLKTIRTDQILTLLDKMLIIV